MSRRTIVFLFALLSCGCATPKTINGRKVLRTLWENGHIVYVLESDQPAVDKAKREAAEAARGVVFEPLARESAK